MLPMLGRGGNSGHITVHYKQLSGQLEVKACGGRGAEPAENGEGGNGRFYVAVEVSMVKIMVLVQLKGVVAVAVVVVVIVVVEL